MGAYWPLIRAAAFAIIAYVVLVALTMLVGRDGPDVLTDTDFAAGLGGVVGSAVVTFLLRGESTTPAARHATPAPEGPAGDAAAQIRPTSVRIYSLIGALLLVILGWILLMVTVWQWLTAFAPTPTWPRQAALLIMPIGVIAASVILTEGHRVHTHNHRLAHWVALILLAAIAGWTFSWFLDDESIVVTASAAGMAVGFWFAQRVDWPTLSSRSSQITGRWEQAIDRRVERSFRLLDRKPVTANVISIVAGGLLYALLFGVAGLLMITPLFRVDVADLDVAARLAFRVICYAAAGWIVVQLWLRLRAAGPAHTRWLVLPLAGAAAIVALTVTLGAVIIYATSVALGPDKCLVGNWQVTSRLPPASEESDDGKMTTFFDFDADGTFVVGPGPTDRSPEASGSLGADRKPYLVVNQILFLDLNDSTDISVENVDRVMLLLSNSVDDDSTDGQEQMKYSCRGDWLTLFVGGEYGENTAWMLQRMED
ncbi:hypothetical protein [Actinoplanes auranticolor]|uniref:Uncharacterized protein n=1 Tax=Actinoplanes auranticolor TaxID=47988 RepID=A0A919VTN2_9ACTN|nr:hypothetical protein [Actinoplanes auranticolor]GIM74950.1 hypothetical protein Aau02nite_63490 [Actinoplanes auranticolor]